MSNKSLIGKKVLMFAPKYFGYGEAIAEELRTFGCEVDLFDERPSNTAFAKIMLRYNIKLYRRKIKQYYMSVMNNGKDYDYVFVIKSEALNKEILTAYKEHYKNAEFILYLWDALDNVPNGKQKIEFYDKIFTFDPVDADKFGLKLRPLFFRKEYAKQPEIKNDYKYEAAFIGTAHTERPYIVNKIKEQCKKMGKECYSYFFLSHIIVFLYNKILNPVYKNIKKKDIHFKPLSVEEVNEIYSHSKCIIDAEHIAQHGLTMRTIEMVGMQKKLITTNKNIKNYDFYNENNICIIDRNNPVVSKDFLDKEYLPIDESVLKKYSLNYFVQEIFGIGE